MVIYFLNLKIIQQPSNKHFLILINFSLFVILLPLLGFCGIWLASMPRDWNIWVTALQLGLNWSRIEEDTPGPPPAGLGAARAATWGALLSWAVTGYVSRRRKLDITRQAALVVAFLLQGRSCWCFGCDMLLCRVLSFPFFSLKHKADNRNALRCERGELLIIFCRPLIYCWALVCSFRRKYFGKLKHLTHTRKPPCCCLPALFHLFTVSQWAFWAGLQSKCNTAISNGWWGLYHTPALALATRIQADRELGEMRHSACSWAVGQTITKSHGLGCCQSARDGQATISIY